MDTKFYVAKKLRELRKEKGLKLWQMARILGVRTGTYHNYESGRLRISVNRLNELCGFFQKDFYYFLPSNNLNKKQSAEPSH